LPIAYALSLICFCAVCFTSIAQDTKDDRSQNLEYLFESNTEGYKCFRIPAIVLTKQGTVLAFAEGRKRGCSDTGNIDLVMKRSEDGGNTWSNHMVVWNDAENTCGNPAPV